jgi:tRNA(Ile)-lysidine synthase
MSARNDLERGFAEKLSAIGGFENSPHLAVALSGGADSMALCLLLNKWCRAGGGKVVALTVDHGLRENSADEAAWVNGVMAVNGIEHVIIKWSGNKPSAAIQEKARAARYEMMTEWCHNNHVLHLFAGHHLGDQEETFWQRLAHGSDVYGLAGMAEIIEQPHIRIIRPLLGFEKSEIEAWLRHNNVEWVQDPSNDNSNYQRVRFRKILAEEGLGAERFKLLMHKFATQRIWLDEQLAEAMARYLIIQTDYNVAIKIVDFKAMHSWLRQAMLSRLLITLSGNSEPLSL